MTTYREERRQDRAAQAQIDRDDEAARSKLRAAERKAAQDRKLTASRSRAARWQSIAAWCSRNAADLLLAPVIAVSVVLSWSSVAAFGVWLFGPAGHAFPVVPDGGMWACAVAVTIHRRTRPEESAWKWQAGTAFFACVTAATNFLHGWTVHGVAAGIAMALVSVSGLAAHQLVTAGQQRPLAERRARAAQRAATKRAKFDLDGAGSTRPVYESGLATLSRRWGRLTLVVEPVKPQASGQIGGSREPVAGLPSPASAEPVAGAHESTPNEPFPSVRVEPPATPPAEPPVTAQPEPLAEPADAHRQTRRRPPARTPRPKTDTVTALIKAGVSNTEIVRRTGVSLATVKRRRTAFKAAGGNVVSIGDRRQA